MYNGTSATVGRRGTEILDVLCGVREGGNSSTTFFNLFFDDLVKELKARYGTVAGFFGG